MAHTLQHRARVLALTIALAIGTIAVLLIAALFVARTPWAEERARRLIVDRVSGALEGALIVERVDGSLLGDVTLHGVAIVRDGLRVIEVDRVRVRYRPIRLWREALAIDEVELVRPRIRLIEEAGGWNLARLARARPAGTPAGEPASFSIDRLTLTEGWLEIRPRVGAPVTLADLAVQTSLEFRRGRLALDVTRGALRDTATGGVVTSLSHTLTLEDRRLTIDDLAIATAGSALTGRVALTIGGEWPDTRVDVRGQPVRVREIVP